MTNILEKVITEEEQEEIKEFISTVLILPRQDRAILLSNANAFRALRAIEKQEKDKKGG